MTARPSWWGGRGHIGYTVAVFVVLASLDNAAVALFPSMVLSVSSQLHTSEAAIALMTASTILISGSTAVAWAYRGDRSRRKRLLLGGTAVWSSGAVLSATANAFWQLFAWQAVTAVGLGSIAAVGYSVLTDFVRPGRRGLMMGLWGISQGLGTVAGGLLASQIGAADFRRPLLVMAALGVVCGLLYAAGFEAPRGFREPLLETRLASGGSYDHGIDRSQLPGLWATATNRWLVLQGLAAQFAYGSLVWVPLLYQEKVVAAGYTTEVGTKVGGIFVALFQVGGIFSILAGHLGDRWQRRDPAGRAKLSTIGTLGAIPFFVGFFAIPLRGLDVDAAASTGGLIRSVLGALTSNPYAAGAFLLALAAAALTGADAPNKLALISDVNLPEHRGTVFSVANLANGLGRSGGTALTGLLAGAVERALPPPANYVAGLSLFQAFFLPSGYCYWRAVGTCAGDASRVVEVLSERGAAP